MSFGPPGGFGRPGGGRPPGPGGPPAGGARPSGVKLDPLIGMDDARKPLRSKLLAVPSLREMYLRHVRTIADDWLDWSKFGPVVAKYAGRAGDGFICTSGKDPELYQTLIANVEAGAASVGRDASGIRRMIEIKVSYDRDLDSAYASPLPGEASQAEDARRAISPPEAWRA